MPLPAEVVATLPEEIRADPALERLDDIPSLAKSYIETKKFVGNSIQLPGKDSKPEDVETWRQTHMPKLAERGLIEAAPGKPEEYEFQPPDVEGYNFDENTVKGFQDVAHQYKLTKAQAQGLLEFDAQRFKSAKEEMEASAKEKEASNRPIAEADAQKEFADQFKENPLQAWDLAKSAIAAMNGNDPGFKDWVLNTVVQDTLKDGSTKGYSLAHYPRFVAAMAQVGKLVSSDHAGNFGKGSGVESADTIQSHIDEIEQSPKFKAGDPETVERRDNLFRKKYGTKEVA